MPTKPANDVLETQAHFSMTQQSFKLIWAVEINLWHLRNIYILRLSRMRLARIIANAIKFYLKNLKHADVS